MVRFIFALWRV